MSKKKKNKFSDTPSAEVTLGQPENCNETVNCYGTYNIQPTDATDNTYPAIAQGLSEKKKKSLKNERNDWLDKS